MPREKVALDLCLLTARSMYPSKGSIACWACWATATMEEKVLEHREPGQLGDKKDTAQSNRSAGFFFLFSVFFFLSTEYHSLVFLFIVYSSYFLMFPSFFLQQLTAGDLFFFSITKGQFWLFSSDGDCREPFYRHWQNSHRGGLLKCSYYFSYKLFPCSLFVLQCIHATCTTLFLYKNNETKNNHPTNIVPPLSQLLCSHHDL